MIRSYLQLVRIPGIFTAFTNVLVGVYFVQQTEIDWFSVGPLLIASGFLFLAGMSLNDYFDYNTDKKERSHRPLASGKIPRRIALYLGLGFLIAANISSSIVGLQSLLLSIVMTVLILSYDIKSKSIPVIGILNLSFIRFLNIILGATVVSLTPEIIKMAIPIAIFVAGISILAKTETSPSKKAEVANILFIAATISYVVIFTMDIGEIVQLGFLVLFGFAVFIPFLIYKEKTNKNIQNKVTSQLLAIIILDATLIYAFSDAILALSALILYIPAYLILRIIYLT